MKSSYSVSIQTNNSPTYDKSSRYRTTLGENCKLIRNLIAYLCYVIKNGWLEVNSHTFDTNHSLQAPSNIEEIRFQLGLCNAFPWSVPSFARAETSHIGKLWKDQLRVYAGLYEEKLEALHTLQNKLISPHCLPSHTQGTYTVETYTCDGQIWLLPLQKLPDGDVKPIGYRSWSLIEAESPYDSTHKECLAAVWPHYCSVHTFRPPALQPRRTTKWIINLAEWYR